MGGADQGQRSFDRLSEPRRFDVLVAGASRFGAEPNTGYTNVTLPAPASNRPAPGGGAPVGAASDIQIPIQPPLLPLQQTACVVYSLG